MSKIAQLAITGQIQWTPKFKIEKGDVLISLSVEDGSSISVIRYDPVDSTVVVNTKKITKTQVMNNPARGLYMIGCANGDFVSNCLVTVEQD